MTPFSRETAITKRRTTLKQQAHASAEPAASPRVNGTVSAYSDSKGCGVIKSDDGEKVNFKSSEVKWHRTSSPAKGQRMSFTPGTDKLGEACATNLQAVPSAYTNG